MDYVDLFCSIKQIVKYLDTHFSFIRYNRCDTKYFENSKIYDQSCFLRNKIFILSSCIVLSIVLWYPRSRGRLQLGKYQLQEIDPGFSFSC